MFKEKYKIGWNDQVGRRRYTTVETRSEAIALASEKLAASDQVSVKRFKYVQLDENTPSADCPWK